MESKQITITKDALMRIGEAAEPEWLKHVYIPSPTNEPPEAMPIISLNGTTILTEGNMSVIIASQGFGKSSTVEATIASYLNSDADCLGFATNITNGIISVDFERTNRDVWRSYRRCYTRAQVGTHNDSLLIAGMRQIPRLEHRLKAIEQLLDDHPCTLLILDGAGDLVNDVNDLAEAIERRVWIREITVKYNTSILTTLHPNPNTFKPRGHIGSELLREAESVMVIKKHDEHTRLLTTDFEHGKNRNAAPVTASFRWSDREMMFVECDIAVMKTEAAAAKQATKLKLLQDLAEAVLPDGLTRKRNELEQTIIDHEGVGTSTAKSRVNEMLKMKIVSKQSNGEYVINI